MTEDSGPGSGGWLRRWLLGPAGSPWDFPRRSGERHLLLVRHGHAAAGWGDDLDPGLDDQGRLEAEAVAERLASVGPLPIVVSPLRRAWETAAPLAARWGVEPRVEPAVGEIRAPTEDLDGRAAWLRQAMAGSWADLGPAQQAWRQSVVDALLAIDRDTVVVTHFVAINTAVGHAVEDDRVACFAPGNASVTMLRSTGGRLEVLAFGDQAVTEVR